MLQIEYMVSFLGECAGYILITLQIYGIVNTRRRWQVFVSGSSSSPKFIYRYVNYSGNGSHVIVVHNNL